MAQGKAQRLMSQMVTWLKLVLACWPAICFCAAGVFDREAFHCLLAGGAQAKPE